MLKENSRSQTPLSRKFPNSSRNLNSRKIPSAPKSDNRPETDSLNTKPQKFLINKVCLNSIPDLEELHKLLRENFSPPHDGKERLNYNSFLTVASKLPLKFRHFFSASTFLKFDRDEYGRIDMQSFFHSIVRKNNLFQTRIHISLYDTAGNGYLTEDNLK